MIDILDPSQSMPQPIPVNAQPVEPVEADDVSIRDNRLEEERASHEDQLKEKRKRQKKDIVELSGKTSDQSSDAEESPEDRVRDDEDKDEHQIDITIE
ncbi:MAG: hypothetical protein V3W14_14005 [Candidatus Neomarinimicrobiota bacterium]